MKRFKRQIMFAFSVFALTGSMMMFNANEAKANMSADCVNCTGGSTDECYRVIVGDETHVYHGKKKAC